MIRSPWLSLAPYPQLPMWAHLRATAHRFPDKPGLIESSGRVSTFRELWDASRAAARFLQLGANVVKGDVVAISTEDTREFVAAMYGTLIAGAAVGHLNPLFREEEMAARLRGLRAKVAVVSVRVRPVLDAVHGLAAVPDLSRTYDLKDVWSSGAETAQDPEPVALNVGVDLAVVGYTSGTGGLPKPVAHTHANETASASQRAATGRAPEAGVVLDLLPIWHTIQMTIYSGATIVQPSVDPEESVWLMEHYRVSHVYGRPTVVQSLLDAYRRNPRDVSSLRLIETSGFALDPRLQREASGAFGCPVCQAYHLSETSGSANRTRLDEEEADSVGYPSPDTEERIVDPDSGAELPVGESGELLIRGPQVVPGYWRHPEATAETFLDGGWLRTGDIARQDPLGRVFIVDRAKDMIKVHGHQVAPAEVEAVLIEHPGVREAAVIPVPAPQAGEVPKAFVVVEPGRRVTADELIMLVTNRLAPYKAVREVEFVSALPKGPGGKTLRRALIERERSRDGGLTDSDR